MSSPRKNFALEHADTCVDFLVETIKQAKIAVNQGGENGSLINAGIKAASTMLAYAHGQPTARFEHSGVNGEPIRTTVDLAKVPTDILRALVAARKVQE